MIIYAKNNKLIAVIVEEMLLLNSLNQKWSKYKSFEIFYKLVISKKYT